MGGQRTIFFHSAFRHGFSPDDYREVLQNRNMVLRSRRGVPNVYEILGRNDAGEYIHIVTRRRLQPGERLVVVFHMSRMNEADRRRYRQGTGL